MKVVIFGATGTTGLCTVQAAIKGEHNVRAFVRDSAKLPDEYKEKVEVIEGNVLNYTDVLNATKNIDAVAVVLGTRNDLRPTTDLSEGMKNIIQAMKENKVEIVSVCLSAFLLWDVTKVPLMFQDLNADHQRMFDALKSSGLKYIAVMPPHIADQPGGEYTVHLEKSGGRVVSKYDLGEFLIKSLSQPEYFQKVVGIATKPNI